jgi:uncharacterized membrane protein YgaE (UPF0421/DUF939 family)
MKQGTLITDLPIGPSIKTRVSLRLASLRQRLACPERVTHGLVHGLTAATAALAAYLPPQWLGLKEGFWAAGAALAVVDHQWTTTRTSGRDQFAGAAIGGAISVVALLLGGHQLIDYAFTVILAVTVCWILNIASAARLAGITATILLLVPSPQTIQQVMVSRLAEVGWGVLCAMVVVRLAGFAMSLRS